MKNRKKKYYINSKKFVPVILIILIIISIGIASHSCRADDLVNSDGGNYTEQSSNTSAPEIQVAVADDGITMLTPNSVIEGTESLYENSFIIANPNDYNTLVNRTYNLLSDYKPPDLVKVKVPFAPGRTESVQYMRKDASSALSKMFTAAKKEEDIEFYGASGYRSYNIQTALFTKKAKEKGSVEEANKLNALPGQSEHQLGLAMDITISELNYKLQETFGDTKEGKWLTENCHRFGFIIRYPKEKEKITGYSYEPWHCRYVGSELAQYIYEKGLTLEEYYGV